MLLHPFWGGSFTSGDGAFLGGQIYEVGICDGVPVGVCVGLSVGASVGASVGVSDGLVVGKLVGVAPVHGHILR